MPDSAPFEIFTGPCEVWISPDVEEAIPVLGAVVSGDWVLLGANGASNIPDSGVTVSHRQTLASFVPLGSTLPTKVWRTAEEHRVRFTLDDVRVEHYKYALNGQIVSTTAAGAGTVGHKDLVLAMGIGVTLYSLLVRFDKSPYGHTSANTPVWRSQLYLPKVYQAANAEPVYVKGTPAGLMFEFASLANSDASKQPQIQQVHAGATS